MGKLIIDSLILILLCFVIPAVIYYILFPPKKEWTRKDLQKVIDFYEFRDSSIVYYMISEPMFLLELNAYYNRDYDSLYDVIAEKYQLYDRLKRWTTNDLEAKIKTFNYMDRYFISAIFNERQNEH